MTQRRLRGGLAFLAGAALLLPGITPAAFADPGTDTTEGMNMGNRGALACVTETVLNSGNHKAAALAEIVRLRQDALNDTNVKLRSRVSGAMVTVREFLQEEGRSEENYLNPKWSYSLERIAIQRAVEAANRSDIHERLNGQVPVGSPSYGTPSHGSMSEMLAWGAADLNAALAQWAAQKQQLVDTQTPGADNLYYRMILEPLNKYFAFGGTRNNQADGVTWAGEITQATDPNEAEVGWQGDYLFKVPITFRKLAPVIEPDAVLTGQNATLSVRATGYNNRFTLCDPSTTITSSDPSIASVDGMTITGHREGTVTLTLRSGDQTRTQTFTVRREIASVANPDAVTTPSGTAPTLPATVVATYNDGATSPVAVTWDAIPEDSYRGRGGGTFTVNGRVEGYTSPVTVNVTVTPATAQSVDPIPGTSTREQEAPTLPETARVTWSNGDTSDEAVTWENIPESSYATPGHFTVNGTVAGLNVSVRVDVAATPRPVQPSSPTPSTEPSVRPTAAPSQEPSAPATAEPSSSATAEVTATPIVVPSADASASASAVPSPNVSDEASPSVSAPATVLPSEPGSVETSATSDESSAPGASTPAETGNSSAPATQEKAQTQKAASGKTAGTAKATLARTGAESLVLLMSAGLLAVAGCVAVKRRRS